MSEVWDETIKRLRDAYGDMITMEYLGDVSFSESDLHNVLTLHAELERVQETEKEVLRWTRTLDEHPEGYEGPCYCGACFIELRVKKP